MANKEQVKNKVIIITNKDIDNLHRDDGHDLRLMKLLKYDKNKIIDMINFDQPKSFSSDNYFAIDIPGFSFRKFYHKIKLFNIQRETILFTQDSFFRFGINKSATYIKYRYSPIAILKSFYRLFFATINELINALYFKKIGYVSKEDFFLPLFFKNKYFVVKNGVSISSYQHKNKQINKKEIRLFFWGNMTYDPNKDSLLIFIKTYWNDLQEIYKNIELHVYGRHDNNLLSKLDSSSQKNIFLEGRFDTHESLFEDNDIFINFIQYGAGIKNKTLEALAYEIPMICTPHALEGIDEIDTYRYVYSNKNELLESMNAILDNFDIQSAQKNAEVIREIYTWENAYQDYIRAVKS